MKTTGEGQVGLVVLAASPGDEIVEAAARTLAEAKVGFAWLVARGTLREAMLATRSGDGRVLSGPMEIASASGSYRAGDAAIDLTAVVSLANGETVGGRFDMAVAEDVEIICFAASPVAPGTVAAAVAARTPAAAPAPSAAVAPAAPAAQPAMPVAPAPPATAPSVPPPAPPAPPAPPPAPPPEAAPAREPASAPIELGPSSLTHDVPRAAPSDPGYIGSPVVSTIPAKPPRKVEVENTIPEPEAGDRVSHFAFGECDVESSDGDRIRLKQDKDDRVREVSLAMLRIEAPTVDAQGRRHFRLLRKN